MNIDQAIEKFLKYDKYIQEEENKLKKYKEKRNQYQNIIII